MNEQIQLDERSIGLILAGLYLLEEHIENDEPLGTRAWNVFNECVYKVPENMEIGKGIIDTIEELRDAINNANNVTVE